MKRLIAILWLTLLGLVGTRDVSQSWAQTTPCGYVAAYFDNNSGQIYALRSDGKLIRYRVSDGAITTHLNAAPGDGYVELLRYGHQYDLLAIRSDGVVCGYTWSSNNNVWEPFANLPTCQTVPVSESSMGHIKNLLKGNDE